MKKPGEDDSLRKSVGVYDRPARANRKLIMTVVIVIMVIVSLALFFYPRMARSAEEPGSGARSPGIFIQWSRDAPNIEAETGFASVYAADLERRPTASGLPYDSSLLTAAHRTLPFGTRLRVTDPATGRSVVVTVNDRWGGSPGWVVNLSRGAAQLLGVNTSVRRQVRLDVELVGDGTRVAPERAEGIAPPVLPQRIEEADGLVPAVATMETAAARRCAKEADILGLRGPWRDNHLRNCERRNNRTQVTGGR